MVSYSETKNSFKAVLICFNFGRFFIPVGQVFQALQASLMGKRPMLYLHGSWAAKWSKWPIVNLLFASDLYWKSGSIVGGKKQSFNLLISTIWFILIKSVTLTSSKLENRGLVWQYNFVPVRLCINFFALVQLYLTLFACRHHRLHYKI